MYLLLLSVCLTATNGAFDLLNDVPRCYLNDSNVNECLSKAIYALQPHVRRGIKEIGLPSFDPLVLPNLTISHFATNAHFKVALRNLKINGLYNYDVTKIEFDHKRATLKGKVTFPTWDVITYYDVQGAIASLPIQGHGYGKVAFDTTTCDFVIKEYRTGKQNQDVCNRIDVRLKFHIEDLEVQLSGLRTGGITNDYINQYPKPVAEEASAVSGKVFAVFLKQFLVKTCTHSF